jgi:hypothetical protein
MAAAQIQTATVIQFSSAVHLAAQQMKARFAPVFPVKQLTGKSFAYDGIGSIEAQELNGRFNRVTFSDLKVVRRKIGRRRFSLTLPIDADDASQVLINQEAEYSQACSMAMARVYDRIGIEAALATVYTGEDLDTAVTFATDGGQTVTATAGLTYEKLLEAMQNFIDADVGNDMLETFLFCISGDEHTALMKELELTSGDYSRQYGVDKGAIQEAVGMKLIKFAANATNPILDVTGGVRSCIALSSRGLCYAMPKQFEIVVQDRSDLVQTKQVQVNWTLGAVRTEGVLVQKVTTTD